MNRKRVRVTITGRVQGVGFRPTVYRHAANLGVSGFVKNAPSGVIVEAEGDSGSVSDFLEKLRNEPPGRAVIERIEVKEITPTGETGFQIVPSLGSGDLTVGMPPDLATCDDCLSELFDPGDRRNRHPFINCTNCGPRFTIIHRLPYDRDRTSMASFKMCSKCASEYSDPADRRFDAQPNACKACGPKLCIIDSKGRPMEGDPIRIAAGFLRSGAIVAVKGLGGYHLCCDALNDGPVRVLRERKRRPFKAMAVMFKSAGEIEKYCRLSEREREELVGPARPIVVAPRRNPCGLSTLISPDTTDAGVFLPYTPLHHLLLNEISPLIMTSGNLADEPIAKDESELNRILGRVADYALVHNRPIVRRCDDSVVKMVDGRRLFLRRSRGHVPDSIELPFDGPSVLGCGAELKNTFCVTRGQSAFVSQHIGDLTDYKSYKFFLESTEDLFRLLEVSPEIAAHDMHPGYLSTRYARESGIKNLEAVQHHHAHIAACMVEHNLCEQVIGVALDGMGMGDDGTVWGGEFLVADLTAYRRVSHFKQYRMPGGDQATLNPERMAFSCLLSELDGDEAVAARVLAGIDREMRGVLRRMIEKGLHSPLTSSAGRLFDAVSAMLGLCRRISYEGQAAIRLQTAAADDVDSTYPFSLDNGVLSFGPMIREIVLDIEKGVDKGRISAMFHNTVALGVCATCEEIRSQEGISRIVLSGGVFQNELLLKLVTERLCKRGFEVYSHFLLPPNDACLALGQAAVALARRATNSKH